MHVAMFQIFVLFTAPISAINSNPSGVYNGASLPFAIKRYLSKKMPFSKHSHQRAAAYILAYQHNHNLPTLFE